MNTNALGDSRAILSESARSQIPPQILDKIIDALSRLNCPNIYVGIGTSWFSIHIYFLYGK